MMQVLQQMHVVIVHLLVHRGVQEQDKIGAGVACQQQLTKTYYFLNTPTPSTYPVIGSIVFTSTTCDATSTLPSGYYKYTSGWLRVR